MSGHLDDAWWCSWDLPIVKRPNPYGNFDRRHFDRVRSLFGSVNHFVLLFHCLITLKIKVKKLITCLFVYVCHTDIKIECLHPPSILAAWLLSWLNLFIYMDSNINKASAFLRIFLCVKGNLRRLHRSKNNHRKIIVIGQIIGSGQIDSFMCIESII